MQALRICKCWTFFFASLNFGYVFGKGSHANRRVGVIWEEKCPRFGSVAKIQVLSLDSLLLLSFVESIRQGNKRVVSFCSWSWLKSQLFIQLNNHNLNGFYFYQNGWFIETITLKSKGFWLVSSALPPECCLIHHMLPYDILLYPWHCNFSIKSDIHIEICICMCRTPNNSIIHHSNGNRENNPHHDVRRNQFFVFFPWKS